MKHLRLTMVSFFLAIAALTLAGQAEYDDCVLTHLKNAKLDAAARLIKQACEENYRNPAFTSAKQRAYNHCLLQHLAGVESLQAAIEIRTACESKHY